ncbi:MAG: hypothetical protein WBQ43_07820 [Terriglobales bacterium]
MARVGKKKSFLESIPMLVLVGLLAGALGGLGIGLIQLRALNSAAAASATGAPGK